MSRIVIAGASGFIGRYLVSAFRARGDEVLLIGRSGPDATWADAAGIRVLPASGRLRNYGGGPERKRTLLALEGASVRD